MKFEKIIAMLALVCSIASLWVANIKMERLGLTRNWNVFSGGVSHSSTTVSSTTQTSILTRNTSRQYASICNTDASADVYLFFLAPSASTSVASSEGYTLQETECYEITPDRLYLGQIYGLGADDVVVSTLEK